MNAWRETRSTGWKPEISVSRWSLSDRHQTVHSSNCNERIPAKKNTTDKWQLFENYVYLPLKLWGLSSAVQRPASPLLASGCAALSFRWTFWGLSHLCPGSRTLCGPQFLQLQLLGGWKKVEDGAGSLFFKVSQWALRRTHQSFKNIAHITRWPKLIQRQIGWPQYQSCYCETR